MTLADVRKKINHYVETVKIRNNVSGYRLNIILNDILDLVSGGGGGDGIFGGSGTVPTSVVADITDKLTLDGALDVGTSTPTTPIYENDFESGTLGDFVTSETGAASPWAVEIGTGVGGGNAARSGATGNNETTSITVTKSTVIADSYLQFDYDLSTEDSFDGLQVYINAVLVFNSVTSTVGYVSVQLPVTGIGAKTIEFRYRKDGGSAGGLDRVLIDNVILVDKTVELVAYKNAEFKSNVATAGETKSDTFTATGTGKTSTLQDLDVNAVSGDKFQASMGDPDSSFNSQGMFQALSGSTPLGVNEELRWFRSRHDQAGFRAEVNVVVDTSTAYNSAGDGNAYPRLEMIGPGGANMMHLVGISKANGASSILSRLQVGVSAPNLANLDTHYVNGNIAATDSLDINTGAFKAKIVAPGISGSTKTVTLPNADMNFSTALTEVLTFGGGSTGDVATLTITNGLVTEKTLVP